MSLGSGRLVYSTLRSNTGSISGSLSPTTTGTHGLMMPAFSKAISGSVSPRMLQWSSPMLVITESTGVTIFVLSKRPPRPVSITATSTPSEANHSKAIIVDISKSDRSRWSNVSCQRSQKSQMKSLEIYSSESPCTILALSLKSRMCGEVKSPVLRPLAESTDVSMLDTEPFPLVPAT